ncbi:MAG: hypothetical protein U0528_01615 [Anaerolineae bacterium]
MERGRKNVLSGAEYKDGRELVGQVNNLAVRALTGGRISTSSGPDLIVYRAKDYVDLDRNECAIWRCDLAVWRTLSSLLSAWIGDCIGLSHNVDSEGLSERYLRPHLSVTQILLVTDDFNFNYCEKLYRQGKYGQDFNLYNVMNSRNHENS